MDRVEKAENERDAALRDAEEQRDRAEKAEGERDATARGDAEEQRDRAEKAEGERDAARSDAKRLQDMVNAVTATGPLPTGYRRVGAQTVTIEPGRSRTIGNVEFTCDAGSPSAAHCTVVVTSDGQFSRNPVLVTAELVSDPVEMSLAMRLLAVSARTGTEDGDMVRFFPPDESATSTGKVSAYVRETGAGTDVMTGGHCMSPRVE